MVLVRYIYYIGGVALFTWLLVALELSGPGGLKLQQFDYPGDIIGTSEYSPLEHIQAGILVTCGLLFTWVGSHCPGQRPIAQLFAGLAGIFFIRELDYFLDRFIAVNLWQALMAIVAAILIVYIYRDWQRFRIAWFRIWPSPGLTMLFAGSIVIFAFVPLVARESLWMAIMGDRYMRIVSLAVEEFVELLGYFLWLVGTIEYAYQSKVIALQEPQSAVAKRRASRQPKSEGRF